MAFATKSNGGKPTVDEPFSYYAADAARPSKPGTDRAADTANMKMI